MTPSQKGANLVGALLDLGSFAAGYPIGIASSIRPDAFNAGIAKGQEHAAAAAATVKSMVARERAELAAPKIVETRV